MPEDAVTETRPAASARANYKPLRLKALIRRAFGRRLRLPPWDNDEILRAELFSIERLEQYAASLATAQQVTERPARRRSLGARLGDNEAVLLAAYRDLAAAAAEGHAISPAAEWLLDNYHLSLIHI